MGLVFCSQSITKKKLNVKYNFYRSKNLLYSEIRISIK